MITDKQQLPEQSYSVVGWRDGRVADEWQGSDEVLARDAARELFARGLDVEVFKAGKFLGWTERADATLDDLSVRRS